MSQPSQEDTCAERFSRDSLGVRYQKNFSHAICGQIFDLVPFQYSGTIFNMVTFFRIEAAIGLYMVAVVEVSGSQIIGIWIIVDHSGF